MRKLVEDFEVFTQDASEELPDGVSPKEGTEILAVRKGELVAKLMPEALVISSDTLVSLDGVPLGKPSDFDCAVRMLKRMSGKAHQVHTGVAVHYKGAVFSGAETSSVVFRELTENEIISYVKTGEPMDKAGSYGIQGLGGKLVKEYEGDYDTIVGLSLTLTERLIKEALKSNDP